MASSSSMQKNESTEPIGSSNQQGVPSELPLPLVPSAYQDILTPETIENMSVVMTDLMPSSTNNTAHMATATVITTQPVITEKTTPQTIAVKQVNKSKVCTTQSDSTTKLDQSVVKSMVHRGLAKNQKVYETSSSKILERNTAVLTQPRKPGKFLILPTSIGTTTESKYTVDNRLSTIKNMGSGTASSSSSQATKLKTGEPTGGKFMLLANQGVPTKMVLTPYQKMLGSKMSRTKITKRAAVQQKSSVLQKRILTSKGTILTPVSSPGVVSQKSTLDSQTIITSKNQLFTSSGQTLVTSEGQVQTPITQQQIQLDLQQGVPSELLVPSAYQDILTPETIENMPVVMTDFIPSSSTNTAHMATATITTTQPVVTEKTTQQTISVKRDGAIQQVNLLNKSKVSTTQPDSRTKLNQSILQRIVHRGLEKTQKVYQTSSSKLLKTNTAVSTQPGKPDKFITLPTSTDTTTGSKYTVGKRFSTIKNMGSGTASSSSSQATSSGQTLVTSERQVLAPITQQQLQKLDKKLQLHRSRIHFERAGEAQVRKVNTEAAKTKPLLIRRSQSSKKLQTSVGDSSKTVVTAHSSYQKMLGCKFPSTTDQQKDSVLSMPLIPLSSANSAHVATATATTTQPTTMVVVCSSQEGSQLMSLADQSGEVDMKSVASKQSSDKRQKLQSPKQALGTSKSVQTGRSEMLLSPVSSSSTSKQSVSSTSGGFPPFAPITATQTKKADSLSQNQVESKLAPGLDKDEQKTLHQLIVQDAMGNQITITEDQVLVLPGAIVDGQVQSYAYVSIDKFGNLETTTTDMLMSLDLSRSTDINNVLQIYQVAQDNQVSKDKTEEVPSKSGELQQGIKPEPDPELFFTF